jgi:hypothetical protein
VPWLIVHRDLRRLPAVRAVHGWVIEAFTQFHNKPAHRPASGLTPSS